MNEIQYLIMYDSIALVIIVALAVVVGIFTGIGVMMLLERSRK